MRRLTDTDLDATTGTVADGNLVTTPDGLDVTAISQTDAALTDTDLDATTGTVTDGGAVLSLDVEAVSATQATAVEGIAVTVDGALDGLVDSSVGAGTAGALAAGSPAPLAGSSPSNSGADSSVLASAIQGDTGGPLGATLKKTANCPGDDSALPDTGGSNLALLLVGGALVVAGTGVVLVAERRRKVL